MSTVELLGYSIHVEKGLIRNVGRIALASAPAHRYAIITDDGVASHWLETVVRSVQDAPGSHSVASYSFPAGEASKTRETWAAITDWMLDNGFGRDSAVIALGGGVVGDVAGFVAATFMRGIPFIQVPTSLLSMVDASVGGKTGVDTPAGKNLVGAFHQPAAVIIDPETLATLPARHVRAGMAEVLKHGAIADAAYFHRAAAFASQLHQTPDSDSDAVSWGSNEAEQLIARSVAIKAAIVGRDERESGLRQILNAGHTIAHAIESASGFAGLHGDAVAIGLVTEARMAERAAVARHGLARDLEQATAAAGLPTAVPQHVDMERLVAAMYRDKKARRGRPSFALIADIGQPAGSEADGWTAELPVELVREVLTSRAPVPNETASTSTTS